MFSSLAIPANEKTQHPSLGIKNSVYLFCDIFDSFPFCRILSRCISFSWRLALVDIRNRVHIDGCSIPTLDFTFEWLNTKRLLRVAFFISPPHLISLIKISFAYSKPKLIRCGGSPKLLPILYNAGSGIFIADKSARQNRIHRLRNA